ncbi:hypothetical protein [Anthocerotibacter panamensis]|uniref:hypothetical protein n=1 Tax=Anthocerotibacter panamensis TaxID=2857077 RepID=UPI001C406F8D|nr:hypothetical protein [Anthocerotibacter panamensis]
MVRALENPVTDELFDTATVDKLESFLLSLNEAELTALFTPPTAVELILAQDDAWEADGSGIR